MLIDGLFDGKLHVLDFTLLLAANAFRVHSFFDLFLELLRDRLELGQLLDVVRVFLNQGQVNYLLFVLVLLDFLLGDDELLAESNVLVLRLVQLLAEHILVLPHGFVQNLCLLQPLLKLVVLPLQLADQTCFQLALFDDLEQARVLLA